MSSGGWLGTNIGCAGSAAVIGWIPRRLLCLGVRTQTILLAAYCWERNRYLSSGRYLSLSPSRPDLIQGLFHSGYLGKVETGHEPGLDLCWTYVGH